MKKKILLISLLIIASISGGVTHALVTLKGRDIEYATYDKKWDVDTVNDALDSLYQDECPKSDECLNNAAPPKLYDGLLPVTIDDDGTVKYADTSNEWYNYCEKRWANAVVLIENPSKTYAVGDTILEADIQSYFVWIPKFKYRLWNVNSDGLSTGALDTAHSIDIVFSTTNTIDKEGISCETPMVSGETGNCNNGEYMTHPAFISLGVNGFWVGKFETGYLGATTKANAQKNEANADKVIIKPNVFSWRSIKIMFAFQNSYNYKRDMDSHMMKNTEWGAVAYLSHSKYGLDGDVRNNNNSNTKTGYGALLTSAQHTYGGTYGDGATYNSAYNTDAGYLASTTGNISGIYDMAGCSREHMASYFDASFGSSGFNATTIAEYDSKYFDVYSKSSTATKYQYRILGDATGEMGPFKNFKDGDNTARYHNSWYKELGNFIEKGNPWFGRGGAYNLGVLAGTFEFTKYTGANSTSYSYRIVLS